MTKRSDNNLSACFVAGTLVHTDKGLVPIEQLKVGDLVLSKPESGEGAVAYQRVLKTFKSPEKHRIMRVGVTVPNLTNAIYKNEVAQLTEEQILIAAKFCENSSYCSDPYYVYCTENHPFWTDELSWLAAGDLFPEKLGTELTMSSCYGFKFTESENYMYETPLFKTYAKDVAALRDSKRKVDPHLFKSLIDFSGSCPVVIDVDIEIPVIYDPFSGRVMSWSNVDDLESTSNAQPFLKLSSQPEHRLYKALNESGYLRTGFDAYCMEYGYTYEETAKNESLFKNLKEKYLEGLDTEYYAATVYNIEVENYHTYFVSEVGLWVHDSQPVPT